MQATTNDHQERKFLTALRGLSHRLPQVRAQYARFLRQSDGFDALDALKEAYLVESNILCKTEMIRAIVSLEEKLGLPQTDVPLYEGISP